MPCFTPTSRHVTMLTHPAARNHTAHTCPQCRDACLSLQAFQNADASCDFLLFAACSTAHGSTGGAYGAATATPHHARLPAAGHCSQGASWPQLQATVPALPLMSIATAFTFSVLWPTCHAFHSSNPAENPAAGVHTCWVLLASECTFEVRSSCASCGVNQHSRSAVM